MVVPDIHCAMSPTPPGSSTCPPSASKDVRQPNCPTALGRRIGQVVVVKGLSPRTIGATPVDAGDNSPPVVELVEGLDTGHVLEQRRLPIVHGPAALGEQSACDVVAAVERELRAEALRRVRRAMCAEGETPRQMVRNSSPIHVLIADDEDM